MSTQPEALLHVDNLCKHFPIMSRGLRRKQVGLVKASDEINFTLHRGETLGLVGESGSGKTTTARAILRAITPTSGKVMFHSKDGSPAVDLVIKRSRAHATSPQDANDLSRPICQP